MHRRLLGLPRSQEHETSEAIPASEWISLQIPMVSLLPVQGAWNGRQVLACGPQVTASNFEFVAEYTANPPTAVGVTVCFVHLQSKSPAPAISMREVPT